jgi:hypothetical protein
MKSVASFARKFVSLLGLLSLLVFWSHDARAIGVNCSCDTHTSQVWITAGGLLVSPGPTSGSPSAAAVSANITTGGSPAVYANQNGATGSSGNYAVWAQSLNGTAVYAQALTGTNNTSALRGEGVMYGIVATSSDTYGDAAYFLSTGSASTGVVATAPFVGGNFASNATTGTTYGLKTSCNSNNCTGIFSAVPTGQTAGYFSGNVNVTGYLTKSGGGFRIDHPQKPGTHYLSHNFAESPEMLNLYRGRCAFDAKGECRITMPSYFSAANEAPEYGWAPIGAAMPGLYVAKEMAGNAWTLAGGVPGKSASWSVSARRADAWAKANNPGVEIEKSPADKGRYLHPRLVGKGPEAAIVR